MIVELASAGISLHLSVLLQPAVGGFCPFSADSNLDAFALVAYGDSIDWNEHFC